jgi:hypothetical protein
MGFFGFPRIAARRSLRMGSLAAIAAMLFAQAALAIAACQLEAKPSRGAALAASAEAAAQPSCHDRAPASDALCVAHCQASDPSMDKAQAPVVVLPVAGLPFISFRNFPQSAVHPSPGKLPPASPPARILFRTLLI